MSLKFPPDMKGWFGRKKSDLPQFRRPDERYKQKKTKGGEVQKFNARWLHEISGKQKE